MIVYNQVQLLVMVLALCFVSTATSHAQESINGPIVLGKPLSNSKITIQDIGTNQVWEIPLSQGYNLTYNWSPDGCQILLRGSSTWDIFSLSDSSIQPILSSTPVSQLTASVGQPLWHPTSKSILFSINKRPDIDPTTYYLYDVITGETEIAFTSELRGVGLSWLSDNELLYRFKDELFIWNQSTKEIETYQSESKPPIFIRWNLPFYIDPDNSVVKKIDSVWVRFFQIAMFNEALRKPEDYNDIFGTTDDIEPQSGFDIYFSATNNVKHVDVNNQFLQSLVMSPSEQYIAVATYPLTTPKELNKIYIYDVANDVLTPISTFPSMYNTEYGAYQPSWSSDERFLTFYTPDGYVSYDLEKDTYMPLSEKFNNFYMRLSWSPVMRYVEGQCE